MGTKRLLEHRFRPKVCGRATTMNQSLALPTRLAQGDFGNVNHAPNRRHSRLHHLRTELSLPTARLAVTVTDRPPSLPDRVAEMVSPWTCAMRRTIDQPRPLPLSS